MTAATKACLGCPVNRAISWRYRHNRPVLNYLRQLGCGPSDVRQLIATHWHLDHIGGMTSLQRATGAAAAAHRIEAAAIAGRRGCLFRIRRRRGIAGCVPSCGLC